MTHSSGFPPDSLCLPEQLILIERLRGCATSQQSTIDNLRVQLKEAKEECRKQLEGTTKETKRLEEEIKFLIEAHNNELIALRVKHDQDKSEAFLTGYLAANSEKSEYENEVLSLKSALSEALAYRQKCLTLQKEISQLREGISDNTLAAKLGLEHAAQPCPPDSGLESARQIQELNDLVTSLQSELSTEKSAREKEREVLRAKIDYETGRHVYYKRVYCEQHAGAVQTSMNAPVQMASESLMGGGVAQIQQQQHSQANHADYCRTQGAIEQDLSTSDDRGRSQDNGRAVGEMDREGDTVDVYFNPDNNKEHTDTAEDLTQPENTTKATTQNQETQPCIDTCQCEDRQPEDGPQRNHTAFLPERDCDVSTEGRFGAASPGTCPTPQSRRLVRRPSKKQAQQHGSVCPKTQSPSTGLPQKRAAECEPHLPRRAQRTALQHKSPEQWVPPIDVHQGLVSHQCDISPSNLDSTGSRSHLAHVPLPKLELETALVTSRECMGPPTNVVDAVDSPGTHINVKAENLLDLTRNSGLANVFQEHSNSSQPDTGDAAMDQSTSWPSGTPSHEMVAPRCGVLAPTSLDVRAVVQVQELNGLDEFGCQMSPVSHPRDQAVIPQPSRSPTERDPPEQMRIDMKKFSNKVVTATYTGVDLKTPCFAPQQESSLSSMPPPAKRGHAQGWRQRGLPFEVFDQALGFLGVNHALNSPEPAPALVRPAIVERRAPNSTSNTQGVGYKFMEVVRKQGARSELVGVECVHCQRFYDALESWGTFENLPGCGHISQDKGKVLQADRMSRQEMCQDASRHRYRNPPCATPQGFWDMGFRDSLDSRFT
eukprot:jgi/Botrbrau1/17432/Bobra.0054s0024.2